MQVSSASSSRYYMLGLIAVVGLGVLVYLFGGSAYSQFIGWVYDGQKMFHGEMTDNLSKFADSASGATAWAVVLGSFLYGVFHAAGPGHGKVILSTYLLAQPHEVKKSVYMSAAASILQGIVAVALVYGLFYVFGLVTKETKAAVTWSERLAFAMVMGIGVILIWRAIKGFGWVGKKAHAHHDAHAHSHDHGHTHSHSHNHNHDHGHKHEHAHSHSHAHAHDHGHHHDENGVCSTCGHAHVPSAEQVGQATDWRTIVGIIFSIGLRPCSGAVLVLVFAKFAGIPFAGVMSVFAISIGTAITVSTLAILSVQARKLAVSLLDGAVGKADAIGNGIALVGGAVLILLGYGLMQTTFDAPIRSMGL